MALVEVKVPDIGDFQNVQIIEVLVKPGDAVRAEQSLITVESDKASMEIPSSHAGVVKEMKVAMGDKVSEGSTVLTLETAGEAAAPAPAAKAPAPAQAPARAPAQAAASAPAPAKAAPAASKAAAAGPVQVVVPDIGDFSEVAVIELLVKPGDTVQAEQSLITVESDKASMEIPSSHAGVVKELKVQLGSKVSKGTPIAVIEAAGSAPAQGAEPVVLAKPDAPEAAAPTGSSASVEAQAPLLSERTLPTAALPPHEPGAAPVNLPHASPSIRKTARELGVPLEEVAGSGPKGRITQADLENFVKAVMSGELRTQAAAARAPAGAGAAPAAAAGGIPGLLPWPQVDFAKFGAVERRDLSRIKKISGANLLRNWVMIPHVTHHDDADITELEAFRVQLNKENEKSGAKLTMLAFLIKACVAALKKFPDFNASLDGDQLVLKKYFHIGFAADTPNGLVVPVLRDADKKGVLEIAKETGELAAKAREGKLGPADMTGGCLSISSLGGIGVRYFSPIINAPEVAILGVGTSSMQPVWDGKAFVPRLTLPLSLSYDHRVIDGASAARFNTFLVKVLGDFRRTML
jgi:pyruvate dehydrogenase E2 component (dihydrolipoamide acetyltransferase)